MGTTSDKLTYLNGTKQALKDSINNIGGSITDETTFRAYATELDNIYSNLPKTTGEGSNLSLTTLKGRINVDDILGDTQQEGTPTPDSPQDINVVTGTQEVLVRGTNLYNNTLPNDIYCHNCSVSYDNGQIVMSTTGTDAFFGNVATTNGTAYSETFGQLVEVEENTDYTFATTNNLITKSFITYFDKNKISTGYLFINSANRTITMPSGTKYVCFRIGYGESMSSGTYKFNVQLELGSTVTAYVPYQEQTNTIHLSSKNLFNDTDLQYGYVGSNGVINTETGNNRKDTMSDYIACFSSASYTASAKQGIAGIGIAEFDSSKTFIKRTLLQTNVSENSITTSSTTKYVIVWFKIDNDTIPTTEIIRTNELQFEKGTKTAYEQYYNYELCKIGTYKDRISKSSGKNLFSGFIKGKGISASTGVETTNTNAGVSDYIPVNFDLNSNYYISGLTNTLNSLVGAYNSNKEFLGRTGATTTTTWNLTKNSFTNATQGTGDVAYIRVEQYYLSGNTGTIDDIDKLNVMLNEGSTALPYEPYGNDWYIERNNLKHELKGTENWGNQTGRNDTETRMMFVTQLADTFPKGMADRKAFCNYFIDYAHNRRQTVQNVNVDVTAFNFHWDSQYSHYIYVKIDRSVLPAETEAGMKQWTLDKYNAGNPMTIYAQIQYPQYEIITNEQLIAELNELEKMMSYNGTTNINISGNLPMLVSVSALKGESE